MRTMDKPNDQTNSQKVSLSVKRRDFIKVGGALTGGAFALWLNKHLDRESDSFNFCQTCVNRAHAQGVLNHKVVHVHAPNATDWDYGDSYYGSYVDQQVVNEMVDRGVMELTGTATTEEAWRVLVPVYQPGQTSVAIKVNMNNNLWWCDACETGCEDWQLKIDALIHPINAVIRGLEQAYPNLENSDIWVFDASPGPNPPDSYRFLPERFKGACTYPGVRFFDHGCGELAGFTSDDSTAVIEWSNPGGIPTPPNQKLTDVVVNATYLINMPILKRHGAAGISLGFKNHFGTIDNCPPLHEWVYMGQANYSSEYSPLVDIYRNPNIEGKTVLIIGDGLFGDRISNYNKPTRWDTFGAGAPNSLFFSTDPVAIDCVMADFLAEESGIGSQSDEYLRLADDSGMGIFERGDPWQEPLRFRI